MEPRDRPILRIFARQISKLGFAEDNAYDGLVRLSGLWFHPDVGRRRGLRALAVIVALVTFLVYNTQFRIPGNDERSLRQLLLGTCWISYDPSSFDPTTSTNPAPDSIERDLSAVRAAGFTGVVTFGAKGTLRDIPKIARRFGLHVIMGVWNPNDIEEVNNAVQQRPFVEAYSVGHNGLDKPDGYSFVELRQAIETLKRRAEKPVASSEEAKRYSERLASLGDWLFPDAHLTQFDGPDQSQHSIRESVASGLELVTKVANLAQRVDRLLLLKIVVYPWSGVPGASLESQRSFFADFLEALQSTERGLPVRVNIVAHSAFDASWKIGRPFHAWDPFTGLLSRDGTQRPAVHEITSRCP